MIPAPGQAGPGAMRISNAVTKTSYRDAIVQLSNDKPLTVRSNAKSQKSKGDHKR